MFIIVKALFYKVFFYILQSLVDSNSVVDLCFPNFNKVGEKIVLNKQRMVNGKRTQIVKRGTSKFFDLSSRQNGLQVWTK